MQSFPLDLLLLLLEFVELVQLLLDAHVPPLLEVVHLVGVVELNVVVLHLLNVLDVFHHLQVVLGFLLYV